MVIALLADWTTPTRYVPETVVVTLVAIEFVAEVFELLAFIKEDVVSAPVKVMTPTSISTIDPFVVIVNVFEPVAGEFKYHTSLR